MSELTTVEQKNKLQAIAEAENTAQKRKIQKFVDDHQEVLAANSEASAAAVSLESFLVYSTVTVLLSAGAKFDGSGVAIGVGDFQVAGAANLNRPASQIRGSGYVTLQAGGVDGAALHVAMYAGGVYVGYAVCAGFGEGAVPFETIYGTWS